MTDELMRENPMADETQLECYYCGASEEKVLRINEPKTITYACGRKIVYAPDQLRELRAEYPWKILKQCPKAGPRQQAWVQTQLNA